MLLVVVEDPDRRRCAVYSGEVKVMMDPQKHFTQYPKIFDAADRTTSLAMTCTTRVDDTLKSVITI